MRLGIIPETLLERVALALGRVPLPLVDTQLMFSVAQTVMVAVERGVFEVLAEGPARSGEVAAACETDPVATRKLLNALVGVRYLEFDGDRFALPRRLRKWLLSSGETSLVDKVRFARVEWGLVEHYGRYLDTGRPWEMHRSLDAREWSLYQRGLRDVARLSADEVSRRTPVPRRARLMLDIGGAHGLFSVAICRRHPGLYAEILDLPEAVAASAELLAAEGMGGRVRHRVGDVFETDLGEERFDLVFTSQFSHHLSDEQNRELARRVVRALRPGGVYLIQDGVRPENRSELRRAGVGALLDLYFGATSAAGVWTLREMHAWFTGAGLRLRPVRWLRTLPGVVQAAGVKR